MPVDIRGIKEKDEITSVQFDLLFDGNVINADSVLSGNLPDTTWGVNSIIKDDTVKVTVAGSSFLVGDATLVSIDFRVVGTEGDSTDIAFAPEVLVNGELDFVTDLAGVLDDGSLFVEGVAAPEVVAMRVDTLKASKGAWVEIPVFVDGISVEDSIISAQFNLFYDPEVIDPDTVMSFRGNVVDSTWQFSVNVPSPGKVSVAMAGAESPLIGTGSLAVVHAQVIGDIGDFTVLDLENGLLNEDPVESVDGFLEVVPLGVLEVGFLAGPSGGWAKVPVFVDSLVPSTEVISAQFTLHYDPDVLRADVPMFSVGSAVDSLWQIAANEVSPGSLKVALAGPTPISGSGPVVDLRFKVVGAVGDSTALDLENGLLNEDPVETVDGVLVAVRLGILRAGSIIVLPNKSQEIPVLVDSLWQLAANEISPGSLKIALAGSAPISRNGRVVNLHFETVGSLGDSTALDVQDGLLNEANVEVEDGLVIVVPKTGGLDIRPFQTRVKLGKTRRFRVVGRPGKSVFTWGVQDRDIGTIDENGVFTAIFGGSTVIRVEDAEGNIGFTGNIVVMGGPSKITKDKGGKAFSFEDTLKAL